MATIPITQVIPTEEQQKAIDGLVEWAKTATYLDSNHAYKTLGGLAGTGKTSCLFMLVAKLREAGLNPTVMAPTGKAAYEIKKKGLAAKTIHSSAYDFLDEEENEVTGQLTPRFERAHKLKGSGDIIICDEASMVTTEILNDLLKFRRPIIFVGDHGQLAPVGNDPRIMETPHFTLEKIHRQAEGSAIVKMAHAVRAGVRMHKVDLSDTDPALGKVTIDEDMSLEQIIEHAAGMVALGKLDQIICGYNDLRRKVNNFVRAGKGFEGDIEVGDRLICTRNNYRVRFFGSDRETPILNGQQFEVVSRPKIKSDTVAIVDLKNLDGTEEVFKHAQIYTPVLGRDLLRTDNLPNPYTLVCDYAWAITAHKAQGSDWGKVGVIVSGGRMCNDPRWLYTAFTRARQELKIYRPNGF